MDGGLSSLFKIHYWFSLFSGEISNSAWFMKPVWSGPASLFRQISYQFPSISVTSIISATFHYFYSLECVCTVLLLCSFAQAIPSYWNILYLHSFFIWLTLTHPLLFKVIIYTYKSTKIAMQMAVYYHQD